MLYGIDIFSGAGGLSLGAEMVGIKISHAVEINPSAAGKSSVSCPLKPSDSAPLKHSTMPP